jgi:hypothetical protein
MHMGQNRSGYAILFSILTAINYIISIESGTGKIGEDMNKQAIGGKTRKTAGRPHRALPGHYSLFPNPHPLSHYREVVRTSEVDPADSAEGPEAG